MTTTINDSNIMAILKERYQYDTILLIATAKDNVPTLRSVDTFYFEGAFWIVSDRNNRYVQEITNNENVMISDGGHNRFWCRAHMIGHPLEASNRNIRAVYKTVFHHWYDEVNNEDSPSLCYIKAVPYKGYLHQNKQGYTFDFETNHVDIADTTHHIDVKLTPFW